MDELGTQGQQGKKGEGAQQGSAKKKPRAENAASKRDRLRRALEGRKNAGKEKKTRGDKKKRTRTQAGKDGKGQGQEEATKNKKVKGKPDELAVKGGAVLKRPAGRKK